MMARRSALLALAAAMAWHAGVLAASAQDIMPPPGLYRIDMDLSAMRADVKSKVQITRNGATGAEHEHGSNLGGTYDRDNPNAGPQNRCINSLVGNSGYASLAAGLAACPNQSEKMVGSQTLVHTSQCADTTTTMRITKIDSNTWDVETHIDKVNKPGPPNMAAMAAMFAAQAQSAPTQAQRDEAARVAAALPAEQAKFDKQYAEELPKLEAAAARTKDPAMKALFQKRIAELKHKPVPGGPSLPVNESWNVKEHWTRIANTCGSNPQGH